MKRSTADPCLCFDWTEDGLTLVISWIDDILIFGNMKAVARTKTNLTARVDCEKCGELNEYVGWKIIRTAKSALEITQPILIQSFSDKFDLPNHDCPTPARVGNVLTKADESDLLGPTEHIKYRSGVEKWCMLYINLQCCLGSSKTHDYTCPKTHERNVALYEAHGW